VGTLRGTALSIKQHSPMEWLQVFIGAAGAHNDVGVLNLSGLVEYLENVCNPIMRMMVDCCLFFMPMHFFAYHSHNNHHAFQHCRKCA
jgi:hypothetical protein